MAMRLNENLDDNGEMARSHDAVYRRHAGSADYLYGCRTAGDGGREGESAWVSSSQPQPRPKKAVSPIYLSVKADKSMFLATIRYGCPVIPALDQLTGGKDTTVFFRADKPSIGETMMK